MIIVNSFFTVVSHTKQWVPATNTLILFPLQKAPWPFRAVHVCLRIGLCTMENSTSWSIWSICACKFIRSSNLISWIIKKLFVLGLFQPRPPWTLEWCRCWDCCGWSWSYHLKLSTVSWGVYLKNKERRIWMRGKPIGSITQVGCFVSSHLTPPAVLSSPMNLK